MIHELAEFERAPEQCTVTETHLSAMLFGDHPTFHGHVAEVDGEIAAMALWFLRYTAFGGAGIYLEQLFVRPGFRRRGLARALLSALARECLDNGGKRLTWSVLNWNSDAIALYDRIAGRGQPQRECTTYLVSGPRLIELAGPG